MAKPANPAPPNQLVLAGWAGPPGLAFLLVLISSGGSHDTTSKRANEKYAQSPTNENGEKVASAEQKPINIEGNGEQAKNSTMQAIEISSSHNECVNAEGERQELRYKEVNVPTGVILNKPEVEKYDVLNSELERMHEVVSNLQRMASVNQPIILMMPYFQPMPSQFFNSMGGFNHNSPPFPSLSMPTMAMSPFASPFRSPNPVPSQMMTDSIMKKLATPKFKKATYDGKRAMLSVKKTNPKVSKSHATKKVLVKQPMAADSSPTNVTMSLLNASPTGYYINQRMPGTSKLKPRNLGKEPPFMDLDQTEIMVVTYMFGIDKDNEYARCCFLNGCFNMIVSMMLKAQLGLRCLTLSRWMLSE
ncbi:hypothetical protein PIB30_029427 [Stylosanthes scabra]|uniref:Uncharacterized protein n=1 Tax=Stylosanthes scabra TaxID=79078 RepID=A0ABU6XC38_9FABA|nr:hypothetical protein [Stylosanthes scabra]